MTSVFANLRSPAATDATTLRGKWGWIVALGIVYLIAGGIALGSVAVATVASVLVVGFMMVMSGVAEMIGAFQMKSWGKFALWAILGALYVVAGVIAVQNPLLAALTLTLILGGALVVSGVSRTLLAFAMPRGSPWAMVLLSGTVTLLVGLVILARWPVSSVYSLGIFLGIDLIFAGAGWLTIGLALRAEASRTRMDVSGRANPA